MHDNSSKKKTMGRRKIEIKKIQKKTNLQVTFTKRRNGLFKKASELSVLCGAHLAILVQSPADKIFAFGHPNVETFIQSFEKGEAQMAASSSHGGGWRIGAGRSEYEEAVRKLEIEKSKDKEKEGGFWWDEPYEGLELHELEEYADAIEALGDDVLKRVEEMENVTTTSSNEEFIGGLDSTSSNLLAVSNDHVELVDYDLFEFVNSNYIVN